MKILFIGDIFGSLGRKSAEKYIEYLKQEQKINLIIANGENSAHGRGITEKIYKELLSMGIDVVTMGNHTWDNSKIFEFLDNAPYLVRPINYPNGNPGKGLVTLNFNGTKISIISIMGRTFTSSPLSCPFTTIDKVLAESSADIHIVDFHGEATSEKVAFGIYVDGRVDAVLGTHTHVPTADNRVLPNGTAYITDVGMTGPLDGVIGMDKTNVIKKFITGLPLRYVPLEKGSSQFNAVMIDIDLKNKKVNSIDRINYIG